MRHETGVDARDTRARTNTRVCRALESRDWALALYWRVAGPAAARPARDARSRAASARERYRSEKSEKGKKLKKLMCECPGSNHYVLRHDLMNMGDSGEWRLLVSSAHDSNIIWFHMVLL